MKPYDATQEFKPFERQKAAGKGHPNKGRKDVNPFSGRKAS